MDIEMPVMTGLDAAEQLADSDCKVIILTTYARPGYFERAKKARVSGYLLKDTPSETLAESIREIMNGKRIYSPELIDIAFESDNPLSREIELSTVGRWETTKTIAEELYLSRMERLETTSRLYWIS